MKRKHFLFITFLLSAFSLFAFEQIPTEQLLLSYLENDADLQKLTLAAEKANLSYETTKIDTGFDINLSTGVISFKTSEKGLICKTSPTVKVNIPQALGLSVSAGTNFTPTSENKKISDTSITMGIDIISPVKKSNDINRLTAERNRNQAIKNLEEKAIEKENAFYNEIKSLLNSINSIIQSEKKLYTDMKDFESVQARGFSKTSSTYRMSEIQVFSDKNTVEGQKKNFLHDFISFYKKCGYDVELPVDTEIMDLIPSDLIIVEPLDAESFNKEDFKELEMAKWNNTINSNKRNINSNFSLSANAGYTFDNSTTNSDTVNIGASSSIGGLNLQAGVNIPVTSNPYPSFTVSAGISPNGFRKNSIKNKQDNLSEQQELLDIKIAENNYDNFITKSKHDLEELIWKKEATAKNYEMYDSLEKDMSKWFKQGIVSESDYLSAKTNADTYKIKSVINDIDLIIYNNNIKKNFISGTQTDKAN